jgi:hypothetical protein
MASKNFTRYALKNQSSPNIFGYFAADYDHLDQLLRDVSNFVERDALIHYTKTKKLSFANYVNEVKKAFRGTKLIQITATKARFNNFHATRSLPDQALSPKILETVVNYSLVMAAMTYAELAFGSAEISDNGWSSMWYIRDNIFEYDKEPLARILLRNYKETKTLISPNRKYFVATQGKFLYSFKTKENVKHEVEEFLKENSIEYSTYEAKKDTMSDAYWLKKQEDLNFFKLCYPNTDKTMMFDLTYLYDNINLLNIEPGQSEEVIANISKSYDQSNDISYNIDGIRVSKNDSLLFRMWP